jgi:curved DNA-binding protein CbpA
MPPRASDPYAILGVSPRASEAEIRSAYRRAVQREHPDHNGGSPEAGRRFEAVQEAYALIRVQRARAGASSESGTAARPSSSSRPAGPGPARADPDLESRLADLERELAAAREVRERARQAAREAEARVEGRPRPSDEELGYIRTEDSFGKILADAASGLLSEAREQRVPERLADLLDELGTKLPGQRPKP